MGKFYELYRECRDLFGVDGSVGGGSAPVPQTGYTPQQANQVSQQLNTPINLGAELLTAQQNTNVGTDPMMATALNNNLSSNGHKPLPVANPIYSPYTERPGNQPFSSKEVMARQSANAQIQQQQAMLNSVPQGMPTQNQYGVPQAQPQQQFVPQQQQQQFVPQQQAIAQQQVQMPQGLAQQPIAVKGLAGTAQDPANLFQKPQGLVETPSKTFDDFEIDVDKSLFKTQEDVNNFNDFRQQAFNSGLSSNEASKFVSSLMATASKSRASMQTNAQQIQQQLHQQTQQNLQNQWGGQYNQNMNHAQQALSTLVPNQGQRQQVANGMNTQAGMNFLAGVNQSMSAQPLVTGTPNQQQGQTQVTKDQHLSNLINKYGAYSTKNTIDTSQTLANKQALLGQMNELIKGHLPQAAPSLFEASAQQVVL